MAKKVAILAVNPVNGFGLFQYLETFFENGISYRVYAVAESKEIRTNSGIALTVDDTVANLKGHEDDYDALVFACGDAIPVFARHASEQPNQDMLAVIKAFADKGKLMVGHCAAALIFDIAGAAQGRRVALHPMVKNAVQHATGTDSAFEADGNYLTAQDEKHLAALIPSVLEALKA